MTDRMTDRLDVAKLLDQLDNPTPGKVVSLMGGNWSGNEHEAALVKLRDAAPNLARDNLTLSERIDELVDALKSIRVHCEPQPSALAKAIVATCDAALKGSSNKEREDG